VEEEEEEEEKTKQQLEVGAQHRWSQQPPYRGAQEHLAGLDTPRRRQVLHRHRAHHRLHVIGALQPDAVHPLPVVVLESGAYTCPLFGLTSSVSDTKYTLNTP